MAESKSDETIFTMATSKIEGTTLSKHSAVDDDDDDDIPIAILMQRKKEAKEKEAREKAAAAPPAAKKPKLADDKGSSQAKSSSSKSSSNEKKGKEKSKSTTDDKTKKAKSSTSRASASSSSSSSKSSASSTLKSTDFYDTTEKGMLVQRLLVRWWYAIQWPKCGDYGQPPTGYEPLDGFPGVFVSTSTNALGKILDLRNKQTCPSLRNFVAKSAGELQELCVKAYEEQIRQLIEAEGEDTMLEATLRRELKEVKKINSEKAEKQSRALCAALSGGK